MPVIIVLDENGRLDRAPVLAFDICFPVANVPVITVLNENGRLDRAPVLAFDHFSQSQTLLLLVRS